MDHESGTTLVVSAHCCSSTCYMPSHSLVGARFDDLEALGYTLKTVSGGADALQTIKQPTEHVHLHLYEDSYEDSVGSAPRAPKHRRSRSVTDVLPDIRTRASSHIDHDVHSRCTLPGTRPFGYWP